MIHINRVRIPRKDIQRSIDAARAAQTEVDAEPDPKKRALLIKSHRAKWVAFRPAFESLSFGKCWYTESKNPGTDDDVDHFRPKGRIAEDEAHGGYYWKAFDWTNFRLSSHRANRLRDNPQTEEAHGKADHFPLENPERRARKPEDSIDDEKPLLLDPCDPFDPPKLTFQPDGTVALAPKYEQDDYARAQVEESRIRLHLDWPDFVDDRTELYNIVAVKVEQGMEHAQKFDGGDTGSGAALKTIVTELTDMTRNDRPYSAAATAYIAIFRSVWWVRDIVLKVPGPMEVPS